MATAIQFLRSSIASLRPTPPSLSDGMPMLNFNASDPGLYFKLNDQSLMKVGPTQIGEFAPNYNATGYDLLCRGEMWLDTTISDDKPRPILKLWNGSDWVAGGGSITPSELPQSSGTVLAGPVTDPDQVPTFRPLEDSDLPDSISPNKLGGYEDGSLLIGGEVGGFAESQITLGDDSLKKTVGENVLTLEVTAGNIAGKGSDGTIKTGDGHIQLNYDGLYSADNRFKFIKDTGTLVSLGPTELGQNALVDTHTIIGATTISGDVELTNVYGLTVGGDLFVGHNVQLGSDASELLAVYNKSEFYSDVFIKDSKALDVDGNLEVRGSVILGETNSQTLTVNATTSIDASTVIGRNCGDTLTVTAESTFNCDVTINGELNTAGDAEFPGDVILGSDCSNYIAIQGTQLNTCDIYIGTNVPDPNSDVVHINASTGDITSKGTGKFVEGVVVSNPLTDEKFTVEGSTGNVHSKGDITFDGFIEGDGSKLFNLAVPNAMLFHGDIDATTATAPAGAQPGDFYLNNTTGTVQATWPDIGGRSINQDQFIYYSQDGPTSFKWNLGSVQNNQGFVTINTPQDVNGSKTFKDHTQFDSTITVAADKATLLGGTLTVQKETQLNDTLTVAANKATTLGGTLSVTDSTTLSNTLDVADATALGSTLSVTGAASFSSTVEVTGATTLNNTLVVTDKLTTLFAEKDCSAQALQVNGTSVFECKATMNGGLDLGPGSNMEISGNLVVKGNTTLGDNLPSACADTLTVNATTSITCPVTITNTLTVSGTHATTLGGTLTVTGNTSLNGTLTVAANQSTTLGGTLEVAADKATTLGGTLTVAADKATTLGGTLSVAADKATTLGGTLTVSKATTLNETLTVAADKASSLGGTLQVLDSTTLFTTKDCAKTALTVNGLSTFNCGATFNEGITIPGDNDLTVGGNLTVNGNTTLGTACVDDTLTITAVTTINCATTISNTLTVSGDHATTLGGALSVTSDFVVNTNKFQVTATSGDTSIAGTLGVTGATTLNNTLAVKGTTTAQHITTQTHNTYDIGTDAARFKDLYLQGLAKIGSTLAVGGKVTFTSNATDALVITGKAKSASTASTDVGSTLVTKDYLTSGSGSGTGQFGYWTRTGTTLSMVNNADAVTLGGTLAITGKTTISSAAVDALAITGKATSASTASTDTATTLVTKDYLTSTAGSGTGQFGYWTRTGTTLSMVNGADAVTLGGTLAVTGVVTVTTNILPSADGGANLGSSSARFANLYTQDMHFSNEGTTGNDVDGTTGDWTLQEGNDHIYFINNKTGAKFRVVMESV